MYVVRTQMHTYTHQMQGGKEGEWEEGRGKKFKHQSYLELVAIKTEIGYYNIICIRAIKYSLVRCSISLHPRLPCDLCITEQNQGKQDTFFLYPYSFFLSPICRAPLSEPSPGERKEIGVLQQYSTTQNLLLLLKRKLPSYLLHLILLINQQYPITLAFFIKFV